MKRSLLSVATACALVASASVAQAQSMSPVKFGVSAGVSVPSGKLAEDTDFSDVVSSGYHVTGHLGFMAPMVPVGLRADVSWNKFGEKDDSGLDYSILSGTLNGIFNLSAGMPASPYILAGVGAYRQKIDLGDCDLDFFDSCDDSETNFGLNGGLGMKFNLSGFSTFAEARYHLIMSKDEDTGADRGLEPPLVRIYPMYPPANKAVF